MLEHALGNIHVLPKAYGVWEEDLKLILVKLYILVIKNKKKRDLESISVNQPLKSTCNKVMQ